MDDEVTRVEGISYLEGASGHGVLSLVFLVVAGLLIRAGAWGGGVMAVVVAFGVSLNGFSIYAWDRLRTAVESTVERSDASAPSRTLTPHSISPEMKAELLAGFLMVGGFSVGLVAVIGALRLVGFRHVIYLLIGGLGAGNLGALVWKYYTTSGR